MSRDHSPYAFPTYQGSGPKTGAAIAAAIDDAIGIPGAVTRLPATPQRLREILDTGRGSS